MMETIRAWVDTGGGMEGGLGNPLSSLYGIKSLRVWELRGPRVRLASLQLRRKLDSCSTPWGYEG